MSTSRIAIRTDTAANWTAENPVLAAGEQGHETDTGRRKIGNGSANWNSIILYREATRIIEDGVVISETLHRSSLTPGQSLDGQPDKVVAHAQVAWTPEVIAAYQAQMAQTMSR